MKVYIYIYIWIDAFNYSTSARKLGDSSALPAALPQSATPRFAGKALSSTAEQCWAYRRGHAEEKKVLGLGDLFRHPDSPLPPEISNPLT